MTKQKPLSEMTPKEKVEAGIKAAKQRGQHNLYELLTEDFVEPAANFYVSDKDRECFYNLWKQFKKTLASYIPLDEDQEPPVIHLNALHQEYLKSNWRKVKQ